MLNLEHYKRRAFEAFLLLAVVAMLWSALVAPIFVETVQLTDSVVESLEVMQ